MWMLKIIFFAILSGGLGFLGAYFFIDGNTLSGIILMIMGLCVLLMIKEDM